MKQPKSHESSIRGTIAGRAKPSSESQAASLRRGASQNPAQNCPATQVIDLIRRTAQEGVLRRTTLRNRSPERSSSQNLFDGNAVGCPLSFFRVKAQIRRILGRLPSTPVSDGKTERTSNCHPRACAVNSNRAGFVSEKLNLEPPAEQTPASTAWATHQTQRIKFKWREQLGRPALLSLPTHQSEAGGCRGALGATKLTGPDDSVLCSSQPNIT